MKPGLLLDKMLVFATTKHAGQFDKGGSPYIMHPLAVMYLLGDADEELRCIALGHDIVEDCKVTYSELRDMGFTERVVNGIKSLTKVPGETYEEYKDKVKANPDAVRVKLADLTHNTDIRRLKGVTERDILRMEKYYKFYLELVQVNRENNEALQEYNRLD